MKYNVESKTLTVTVRELVETARRGIPSHGYDDTVGNSDVLRLIDGGLIPKDAEECDIKCTSSVAGIPLVIDARGGVITGNALYTVKEISAERQKPSRDETSIARGIAFIIARILAHKNGYDSVMSTILYVNESGKYLTSTSESVNIKNLDLFFDKCTRSFERLSLPEIERLTVRLPSMKSARFPFGHVRDSQHEFITSVYKNLTRGGTLFAAAPTGTGKTVSVLYPAVRALGAGHGDKVFYFTPKNTTANAARECILEMCAHGVKIKAVIISAKERLCKRKTVCRDDKSLCPAGGEGKVAEAALTLYGSGCPVVGEDELTAHAEAFGVCPHELSLTYSELCDIIICDINYLFDPRVRIKRYFQHGGRYFFLIDEAHNLPDRAREIYSADMTDAVLDIPLSSELIGEHSNLRAAAKDTGRRILKLLFPYVKDEIHSDRSGHSFGFANLSEPPYELYDIFAMLVQVAERELLTAVKAKDSLRLERIKLIKSYLDSVRRVHSALEQFDGGYEMFIFFEDGKIRFKLFCIDPSRPIASCLALGAGSVFFSATLTPISYYRSVLGADRSASELEVDSPFDSSQLSVTVMDKISTRLRERDDTLLSVCKVIAACVSAKRGHYIVFSPSFSYSEALAKIFSAKYPRIAVLNQTQNMSGAQKREFLSRLEGSADSYLVAFCVTGGIFAEGIDLVGDRLIGAVIVGIGIPAVTCEREAIAAYYNEKCDEGKQYAYIYPGMNRIFQAAGRVIRREDDRGAVVLIDDRFADPIYGKCIPRLWHDMAFCDTAQALRARLDEFWRAEKK